MFQTVLLFLSKAILFKRAGAGSNGKNCSHRIAEPQQPPFSRYNVDEDMTYTEFALNVMVTK